MNNSNVEVLNRNPKSTKDSIIEQNQDLAIVLSQISGLKQIYDSVQLSKDVRVLQDASRIQNMCSDLKSLLLAELQRRKLIKQILDSERN